MGWNDHLEDNELSNLPGEAFVNGFDFDGPFDPNNNWLGGAKKEDQLIAVREWFLSRYCDPAKETPYSGREGGYMFVNGGPFDPAEEIPKRFAGFVGDNIIKEIVDELHAELGDEWAPIDYGPPPDYDDRFDFAVMVSSEPLRNLRDRLQQSQQVLSLQGDEGAKALACKLVFSAAIGALETYLWETVQYWIDHDDKALRDFITKIPVFRDQMIKLGDIFEKQQGLKNLVKGHLQNLVWHRWDKVVPLFREGLGVQLPSMKRFDAALLKRHDIVHRSGHSADGVPTEMTVDEARELCATIEVFAQEVDGLLANRADGDLSVGANAPEF